MEFYKIYSTQHRSYEYCYKKDPDGYLTLVYNTNNDKLRKTLRANSWIKTQVPRYQIVTLSREYKREFIRQIWELRLNDAW